jgi:hypothetical protein
MLRRSMGTALFIATSALVGLGITSHHQRALGEGPQGVQGQKLKAPTIPKLVEEHQDLTYEGLVKVLPGEPTYRGTLDFDPAKARYFDLVRKELELTDEEVEIFQRHGFVSIDNARRYTFTMAYYEIYSSDLPVLITSDSILHALHKSYDDILKELETTWFTWTMDEILAQVHVALETEAKKNADERLAENYRDVDLYVTVARNLLAGAAAPAVKNKQSFFDRPQKPWDGKLKVHSLLGQDDEVVIRLKDIQSLELQNPNHDSPTEIYGGKRYLDYSQFQPRGHYTKSDELRNYFRCMMWLGRADTGWNVLPTDLSPAVDSDDRRELRNAVLLVRLLRQTGTRDRLQSIDRIIAFMVGSSDSLNVFRLEELLDKMAIGDVSDLAQGPWIAELQEAIGRSQAARQLIRSQIMTSNPNDLYKVLPPATFQVFGQRFAIDSYVMSHLVFDSVIFNGKKQRRMMPAGLDVAAALGNDAAVPLLESDLRKWHYSANLLAGRKFTEQQDREFWNTNLYSLWLDCLRELDSNVVDQPHAPQVMQTKAWQMKQLQTQLASWSQLRHDTVLYAKQSYTGVPSCEYPAGYVEPYPEFYAKVKAFAVRAGKLIEAVPYESRVGMRDATLQEMHDRHLEFFTTMAGHIGQLETLSRKELAAKPFTKEEQQFVERTINNRGSARLGSGSRPTFDGWYTELFYQSKEKADASWEATIADVHTDPDSKRVLQVGVGDLNLCVIAIDNQDDRVAYVGPVFSYYEFLQPAEKRLTDREWERLLRSGKQAARPSWVESFVAPPQPRPKYGTYVTFQRGGDRVNLSIQTRSKNGISSYRRTAQLTDDGLAALAHISHRTLDLSRSSVTDKGLIQLRSLDNLRNLDLSSTRVDGSGLAAIEKSEWLRVLILRDTQVSDGTLTHLKPLRRLEILNLSGTKVTSGCVEHLQAMPNLRELDVQRTKIDDAGFKQLRAALPKCVIIR